MTKSLLAVLLLLLAAPMMGQSKSNLSASAVPTKVEGNGVLTPTGLRYWDIQVGTGAEAKSGRKVTVHYTGWLLNGTKFDSSVDRGRPFEFKLGAERVIKGWDEGIAGMKVGGKRQLRVPSRLGYGASGAGNRIPPDATLLFDIELLAVQ